MWCLAACGVSLPGAQSSHLRAATSPRDGPFPHNGGRTEQRRGTGSWGDPTSASSALGGEEEEPLAPACGTPTAQLAPGRGRGHTDLVPSLLSNYWCDTCAGLE